ncbi:CDP-alcohol phosphatidyltransferase [Symmachiella dynata]|uniref:CDP-diacylglycerol--serine O-phosphatidyltransferase n=1 Tax=Symmachiella dynata TaxID=2527995 RepID=A0A517ZLD0_9PLAN|nr:CDP-diacylglycerol--serine O-phosphatidyltransferase [Symmachiella dynata]QDU43235.1 CDP-alcohol phosphatidyltransferase [Symmachiella dynata]
MSENFEESLAVPVKTQRTRRQKMFAVVPTLLTLGNVACGFGSITFAAKLNGTETDPQNLFVAGLLIFVAMVFDMLDGSAARLAKNTSDFGAELDSLCDAVSFGVAPAFILVKFSTPFHGRMLWAIAVLYVMCAVLRLARFNVETGEEDTHESFSGLPSPAAAGTVAAFAVAYPEFLERIAEWQSSALESVRPDLDTFARMGLPFITLAVGCLMVSRIRYPHVFNQLFRGRQNYHHMLQLIFTIAAVYVVREMAVPLIFCAFAFGAPLRALWGQIANRGWRNSRTSAGS